MPVEEIHSEGGKLSVILSQPQGKIKCAVLMLHGGPGGNKDGPASLFAEMERKFLQSSIATCRFDFRGSGDSSGSFRDVTLSSMRQDLNDVERWVRTRLNVPLVYIGESLGATIAIYGVKLYHSNMVLLWPAIDLRATSFRSLMTSDALAAIQRDGFIAEGSFELSQQFVEDCMTLDLWPKIVHLSGKYLLIHGELDNEVPVSQSERFAFKLGPAADFISLSKAGHGAKEPESQKLVVDKTVAWVRELYP